MQSWPGQAADCWKANWKRVLVLFIVEMVNLEEAGGGVVHKLRWPFANYWPSTYPRLTLLWWRNSFTVNLHTVDISSTTPTYLGLSMSFVNDPEVKGAPCGTTKLHTATYSSLTGDQPRGLSGLQADSRSVFLVDTMLERQRQIGVLNQLDKTNGLFHLV